jgi:hypothetical protein
MFIVFSFVTTNVALTIVSHKYVIAWIYGLYGVKMKIGNPELDRRRETSEAR